MVKDFIGVKTEKVSALVIIVSVFLLIALQFFVLGNFIHTLFNFSKVASVLISCGVVASYLLLGGYKTIVKTDILQFFIMLLVIPLLFFTPLKAENALNFASIYQGQTFLNFFLMALFGFILSIAMGDFWQRIFSASSEKTAKNGILACILSYLIMTIPMTLLGISAQGVLTSETISDNALFTILNNPYYPKFMASFLSLILISTVMSTIDTFTYLVSSTIIKDFSQKNLNKTQYVKKSRVILFLLLILSAIISFYIESVIAYLFAITGMFTILAPLFFLVGSGLIKTTSKKLDLMFSSSLLISLLAGVYFMINGFLFTSMTASLILPAISTVLIICSLFIFKYIKNK